MKENIIIENLREILIKKINTLDLDNLRATYFALMPITADPELKVLLFGEPEPDDEIKEQLPAPSAIQQDVQSKSVSKAVKEDLPAGTFAAEDTDDLPVVKFYGSEICNDHSEPAEDTLLEKIPPHYNDTAPAKKPELPQGNPSGECWVITRSYGFIPDGPGYDITGDELVYGIYDSWEPAISEFRNIAERTGKDIDEGPDYYKITDWNPATGTAGYILKKHGVNGIRADEDEFCELLYAAAAESAALGMTAYLEGDRVALITEIANLVADITKNTEDAEKIFGLALTDNIRNALEVTEETLSKLTALMLKMK